MTDFEEKPKTPEKLRRVRTDPESLARFGLNAEGRPYLASMGIYLFNRATMVQMLASGNATDFGKEMFPQVIAEHRVQAHLFDGYWEDIGTIGAFHKANIDLTLEKPPFDFTFGDHPIFTRPRYLPCSRLSEVKIKNSLISDGCIIGRGSVIENSVIGVRAQIGANVTIRNTYIMGADSYESPAATRGERPEQPAEYRDRREFGDRERDHRQERTDWPGRPDHERGGSRRIGGTASLRHPRLDRGHSQVHRPPGPDHDLIRSTGVEKTFGSHKP